jgi:hypothetical protein
MRTIVGLAITIPFRLDGQSGCPLLRPTPKICVYVNAIYYTMVLVDTLVSGVRDEREPLPRLSPGLREKLAHHPVSMGFTAISLMPSSVAICFCNRPETTNAMISRSRKSERGVSGPKCPQFRPVGT